MQSLSTGSLSVCTGNFCISSTLAFFCLTPVHVSNQFLHQFIRKKLLWSIFSVWFASSAAEFPTTFVRHPAPANWQLLQACLQKVAGSLLCDNLGQRRGGLKLQTTNKALCPKPVGWGRRQVLTYGRRG